MQAVEQSQDETVSQYAMRVQSLLDRLTLIYDSSPEYNNGSREIYKLSAKKDGLRHFLFGLKTSLQTQVRCERPSSFEEARSLALEFESQQMTRTPMPPIANASTQPNRDTNNKFLNSLDRLNRITDVLESNIHRRTGPTPNPYMLRQNQANIRITSAIKHCNYCGINYHDESECKKKRYDTTICSYCGINGHEFLNCRKRSSHLHEITGSPLNPKDTKKVTAEDSDNTVNNQNAMWAYNYRNFGKPFPRHRNNGDFPRDNNNQQYSYNNPRYNNNYPRYNNSNSRYYNNNPRHNYNNGVNANNNSRYDYDNSQHYNNPNNNQNSQPNAQQNRPGTNENANAGTTNQHLNA